MQSICTSADDGSGVSFVGPVRRVDCADRDDHAWAVSAVVVAWAVWLALVAFVLLIVLR